MNESIETLQPNIFKQGTALWLSAVEDRNLQLDVLLLELKIQALETHSDTSSLHAPNPAG